MQKKVRILMVLLCLFLFPIKVFALEETVGNELNESNDDVAIIESVSDIVTEIVHAAEGEESDAELIDSSDETDVEETEVETDNETEVLDSTTEEEVSADDTDETIGISTITINGVTTDLTDGELPTFTGTISSSEEGYSLAYEEWNGRADDEYNYGIYSSDPARNTELASYDNVILTTTFEGSMYTYSFAILVKNGYSIKGYEDENKELVVDVVVNGKTYSSPYYFQYSTDEGEVYGIHPNIYSNPISPEYDYIESVELENINKNITVGKAPTYTATVGEKSKDHIIIGSEVWSYEVEVEDEDGTHYDSYNNFSNSKFNVEDANTFDTFEEGKTYYHVVLFSLADGIRLKTFYGEDGFPYHKVIVDGVEVQVLAYGFPWFDDESTLYYFAETTPDGIVPATAEYNVTEGANSTISSDDSGDLDLVVDASPELFNGLIFDDKSVTDNFTVSGDTNTRVTLKNALLKTLGAGAHNIILTFIDGKSAYTTLTIEEAINEVTTNPVAAATSNSLVYYSYTDNGETTSLAENEEEKDNEKEVAKTEKDDKKKTEKPDKAKVEKSNSTFYIILVILFLIIVAVPFVVDRKKQ